MKVIEGGKKGKDKQSKGTKKEREQKQKLKYQADLLKNLNKLVPLDEVLDENKYEFTMTKKTEGELTEVILKFKPKKSGERKVR